VFDVLLHPTLFTPQSWSRRAPLPVGTLAAAAFEGESAHYLDKLLHVDTRCGCPTICSPRSTAQR
jgi:hypothetical protein